MSRDNFIEKAKQKYGDRYDYRGVPDIDLQPYTRVPIYCDKHGLFYQSVYDHLEGKGCFDCYKEKRR